MSDLKKYRLELGLTQKQMAEKMEVPYYTYIKYEQGQRKMPYQILGKFIEMRNRKADKEILKTMKELGYYE